MIKNIFICLIILFISGCSDGEPTKKDCEARYLYDLQLFLMNNDKDEKTLPDYSAPEIFDIIETKHLNNGEQQFLIDKIFYTRNVCMFNAKE